MPAAAELLARAEAAREHAYAPYSRFAVGAALASEDGRIFTGVNVENASYGVTLCAERAALASAIGAGARAFTALAVAGPPGRRTPPCGLCRQALAEFGGGLRVVYHAGDGEGIVETPLAALLPDAFAFSGGAR